MSLATKASTKLNDAHEIIAYYDECATLIDISSLIPNSRRVEMVVANAILNFSKAGLGRVVLGRNS
jgi:hypothetical protein